MATQVLAGQPRRAARLDVLVSLGGVRIPLSRARVERLARAVLRAERVTDAVVSVAFVSRSVIASLNRTFLGHRGATDVITFGFGAAREGDERARGAPRVADIYICPDVVRSHARAVGVGVTDELVRVTVHGLLHAVGWDHPDGASREGSPMWRRQESLVSAWRRRERAA